MANVTNQNPIFYDTAGANAITDTTIIRAIVVYPTAATWDVVLHDANGGNLVFKANGTTRLPFGISFPGPLGHRVTGIYPTTLTAAEVQIFAG